MVRRYITLLGSALLLTFLFAGSRANADRVHFRYTGGRWSHVRHAGWHRYWGGPSIGFYYAPAPVYVVAGYSAPRYYSGPDFWYSNPSFGLSINLGGGGYRHDYIYRDRYYRTYHRDSGYRVYERGHGGYSGHSRRRW